MSVGQKYACRLVALLGLVLVSPGWIHAQRVSFFTVAREVVEARFQRITRKNIERKQHLVAMFQEAGCSGLSEQEVKYASTPNVICVLPGETSSVIVVGAHLDLVSDGWGAIDNWTGAALLPTLFESLRHETRRHTFIFIGFSDEEKGLIGSDYYTRKLTKSERERMRGMVNLDSLGASSTKVWASKADKNLLQWLARTARSLKVPLEGVNVEKVGTSDGESFAFIQVPNITIHSLTQETFRVLHTNKDVPAAVKMDDYYQTYRLVAAYLAVLDSVLTPPPEQKTEQPEKKD